ncbi:MAG: methyltransferase domain-containing protein [Mycobacteriales bacterium]
MLSVGCGQGRDARLLAGLGAAVTGVDVSERSAGLRPRARSGGPVRDPLRTRRCPRSQAETSSRSRWLITVVMPSSRIDTPYNASAISMVRF